MPEYFRGLDKGLKWLKEMQEYEIDTDGDETLEEQIRGFLGLVVSDYMNRLEKEKAEALTGTK